MFRRICLILSLGALLVSGLWAQEVVGRNDALEAQFTQVFEKTSTSVVSLHKGQRLVGYAVGIGDGYFLTASRVAEKGLEARTRSAAAPVELIATDHDNGVALLRCSMFRTSLVRRETPLRIGEFVASVGSLDGLKAAGVVGQTDRMVEKAPEQGGGQNIFLQFFADDQNKGPERSRKGVIHHDAPLTTEDFGSALVDADGKLVGINVDRPFRGSSHAVAVAKIDLETLKKGQDIAAKRAAFLGIQLETSEGVVKIAAAVPGGAAEKAGIQGGDILLTVAGQKVGDFSALKRVLSNYAEGDTVDLEVKRGDKNLTIKVLLGGR